jgi:hypothetical protein
VTYLDPNAEFATLIGVIIVAFLFFLTAGWITLMVIAGSVRKARIEAESRAHRPSSS